MTAEEPRIRPIGVVRSSLRTLADAPRQGGEEAPDAWLVLRGEVVTGLEGIGAGDEIIVLTWLHRADRDVLKVHPRSDPERPFDGGLRDPLP